MHSQLLDLDPNEKVLHDIRKHAFGIYEIIFVTIFIVIAIFATLFLSVRYGGEFGFEGSEAVLVVIFALVALTVMIGGYVAVYIYKANELVITNENIIQTIQVSLFNRKVSQLSLAKIQDVSADQSGVLPTLFGYGTITIETAGEASNFKFTYSPEPNLNAKRIIEAYEGFLKANSGHTHQHPPGGPVHDV